MRLSLSLLLLLSISAHAAADEYDFSWLDPDKKIYVVQNRKYTKASKFEIVLGGGIGMDGAYRDIYIALPRFNYFFSESFGISFLGGFVSHDESETFTDLKTVSASALPVVRDINNFMGGSFSWIPFYGKINVFNTIIYLDWHFEIGAALVNSEIDLNTLASGSPNIEEDSHIGFFWGTGQKFFLSRNWALRLDLLAIYYQAPDGIQAQANNASNVVLTNVDNVTESQYFLTLGLSFQP